MERICHRIDDRVFKNDRQIRIDVDLLARPDLRIYPVKDLFIVNGHIVSCNEICQVARDPRLAFKARKAERTECLYYCGIDIIAALVVRLVAAS